MTYSPLDFLVTRYSSNKMLYLAWCSVNARGCHGVQPVQKILVRNSGTVEGVLLEDGTEIHSKLVLSNATAKITFIDLLDKVSTAQPLPIDLWSPSDRTVWTDSYLLILPRRRQSRG